MREMRIFAAGVGVETNTFAPFPAGHITFEEGGIYRGNGSEGDGPFSSVFRLWKKRSESEGFEFVEGFLSHGEPAGRTPRAVYEGYRDEILAGVENNGPFDVVLLALHGAMVAEGYDDCEGDLITRVRQLLSPGAVIGTLLDPHCHLSDEMLAGSDLLIAAKEYPHTDFAERAIELLALCVAASEGAIRPTSASFDCRMVGWYPTTREPMHSLVQMARTIEQEPGVLSASIVHGFPWADVAIVGTKTVVVTNGDPALASAKAEELGRAIYAQREELLPRFQPLEQALDHALSLPGRVVIADIADNAGGGAPADSTFLLREMVRRNVQDAVSGLFWDPIAVRICEEAGVGANLMLRLGGKCGPVSGEPLDLAVTVRAVESEHGQTRFGTTMRLGPSAWVACGGIDIVLTSRRTQTFSPDAFTGLGIDLDRKRLIAVKSSHHYHAGFHPIADHIVPAATPGTMQLDFANMAYSKRDPSFFPRVHDPLSDGGQNELGV